MALPLHHKRDFVRVALDDSFMKRRSGWRGAARVLQEHEAEVARLYREALESAALAARDGRP